jgi:hypothetical protein
MENEQRINNAASYLPSEKYGYIFMEDGIVENDTLIGFNLRLNLTEQPTKQHFDIKYIEAKILDADRGIVRPQRFALHPEMTTHHLFPGNLRLVDQNEKNHKNRVFYTFGGLLVPRPFNHHGMTYDINSNAPIIEVSAAPTSQEILYWQELAQISEAELAKIRAAELKQYGTLNTESFLNPEKVYQKITDQILTRNHISAGFRAWLEAK